MPSMVDVPPAEAAELVADADPEWRRRFVAALDERLRERPLERLMASWDLTASGAARIFGVSRQAFARWLAAGPPPDRSADVAALAAAGELLERYVRRERIPAVVRRRADALGGRSLLEMATGGELRAVLDAVRTMFDLRRVQP